VEYSIYKQRKEVYVQKSAKIATKAVNTAAKTGLVDELAAPWKEAG